MRNFPDFLPSCLHLMKQLTELPQTGKKHFLLPLFSMLLISATIPTLTSIEQSRNGAAELALSEAELALSEAEMYANTADGNMLKNLSAFQLSTPCTPSKNDDATCTSTFTLKAPVPCPRTLSFTSLCLENIAPAGTTSAQSVAYGSIPSDANDGNTDGLFSSGSVYHGSENETDPWWQVDLGSNQTIEQIVVWNRTDCCGDRLDGAVVEILDAADVVQSTYSIPVAAAQNIIPVSNVLGQKVRVRLEGDRILTLAEVQVYTRTAIPPATPEIAVTDNDCVAATPGTFTITTACETGSTIEWSTDSGTTWSATVPTYTNASTQTVTARCVDDTDNTCVSVESAVVVSSPSDCCPKPNCFGIGIQQN